MDICFGVFCLSINCVKVLNSMLKDYVCQGLCVLYQFLAKNSVHFPCRFLTGIMPGIFNFTAEISLLHSIFLLRILPEFLLI